MKEAAEKIEPYDFDKMFRRLTKGVRKARRKLIRELRESMMVTPDEVADMEGWDAEFFDAVWASAKEAGQSPAFFANVFQAALRAGDITPSITMTDMSEDEPPMDDALVTKIRVSEWDEDDSFTGDVVINGREWWLRCYFEWKGVP